MNKVIVIKMSIEHLDDVMTVENASFRIPWSREAFTEEINHNPAARYYVVEVNKHIVGYAGLWKVLDEGHITNIAVHPEFRGQGIGSLLLEALLYLAKQEEIVSMTLEVRKSNLVAQGLYTKYGFSKEGIRKAYYADNKEDAVIMWKREF